VDRHSRGPRYAERQSDEGRLPPSQWEEIACGGCYARLYLALTMIQAEEGDPFDIACAVFDAMKSESKRVQP
jgi:hypothetical protein